MNNDTKGAILIALALMLFMGYNWVQSDRMFRDDMATYKLCNALNDGDYQATNDCYYSE